MKFDYYPEPRQSSVKPFSSTTPGMNPIFCTYGTSFILPLSELPRVIGEQLRGDPMAYSTERLSLQGQSIVSPQGRSSIHKCCILFTHQADKWSYPHTQRGGSTCCNTAYLHVPHPYHKLVLFLSCVFSCQYFSLLHH